MEYELWNVRHGLRVASWASEAEAADQLRQQPGLASEPVHLILRNDDGTTTLLADETSVLGWAQASAAPTARDEAARAGRTAATAQSDSGQATAGAPADGPRDPRVLLRNAIAQSRAATASLTGQPLPAGTDQGGIEAIEDLSNPDVRAIGTAGGASGLTPTTSIEPVGDGRT